ncbi:MAG: DUF4203 domain-containing protein [Propionicimonas sp.]|uniref:TM7S3/TM198-like domain-containing protein n=1 Tax=Propionicimonas sp. TaxID=1955623 RepID=UPI003D0BDC5A
MVLAMDPVWVGVAEIVLGLVFCFLGYPAARVVLALWGALVGFGAGLVLHASLLQSLGDSVLSQVPWWVFALVLALVVAWLAFAFYAVAVLISMGAVGWGLGQVVSSALHTPGWIAFSMGLVVAAGLVMVGWALNLPKVLLIVLTALVGAGTVLDGVQAVLGNRLDWFNQDLWRTDFTAHFAWTIGFVVLAILGMVAQFRQRSDDNLRDAYKRD